MNNLTKRVFLGSVLGGILGVICFAGFTSSPDIPAEMIKYQVWAWDNPMMWSTIANRYIIGFFVAIMGFMTIHPCFKFKMYPFFRGAVVGFLISLPWGLGALIGAENSSQSGFWFILIAGIIIGSIIDTIITKVAGEGNDLVVKK